ncbi:MAG TPA: GlsB/YeaQ/YmgE family stress response membrane protein [Longimicrobiales bacterium]|nr:GlsB/YeaQ/YmgE family stress response membrane protein [Longimicrobiales bacterium]
MNLLTWVLLGLVAGGLAKLIFPGKDPGGCLVTIAIGVLGALLGGFLGTTLFDWGTVTGFDLKSVGIAVAGSLILLALFRLMTRNVGPGGAPPGPPR